ncbi:MAG TPA: hypothetical protein VN512_13085 [Clostridia bacterium]|nr:hypothetical protein [Clostridia bacterium]
MNAEEIVKQLRHIAADYPHSEMIRDIALFDNAADLIESQAAKIAELNDFQNSQCAKLLEKLGAAERRERAAVELMRGQCFACRKYSTCPNKRGPHKHCWLYIWGECGPQEAGKGDAE